jgi:small GTP-binding protein
MKTKREDIRNIAIIAHVDHGKTTLVDELLKQSGTFRANQEVAERVMDSNDIERERGITILSKNTAITYKDTKINIIDTPGHADFGGEVERVLKMVNGVILVVDAFEGVMPQTKFVLQKALDMNLSVIVCINKIDRPEARPEEVIDEILELFIDLDANEDQLDCPFIFASAKSGYAMADLNDEKKDMQPLFDCIVNNIPALEGDPYADTQMLISTIDYNEFVGRIGVGKIDNGSLKVNQEVMIVNHHDPSVKKRVRITKLYTFNGLNKVEVNEAGIGEIVAVSGIADIHIGDTICSLNNPVAIPFQKIEVAGQFRSYNRHEGTKNKLVLSIFVRELRFLEDDEMPEEQSKSNQIFLDGYVCKPPIYRKTPLGREIADILVAVNRPYGKSDYIPCIAWGRNARFAGGLEVGAHLQVSGRVQSREYTKKIGEEEVERRVAYEVSVSKIDLVEDEE